MNELKVINVVPGVIETNFEEFHAKLKKAIEDYKGLVVTPENLKEMKNTRKELTAAIKIIDSERKIQKKQFLVPLNIFEEDCKTAIATIEEAEKELKEKIDVYDEQERQRKLNHAEKIASELTESFELAEKFAIRIDKSKKEFTNVTTSFKKITEDITIQVKELARLQQAEIDNKAFVLNQLKESSKLAGLSTELIIDDVKHLIDNYESLNLIEVTAGINAVASRHKEAEEEAVRVAEERIRKEEEAKAREKARQEQLEAQAKEEEKEIKNIEFVQEPITEINVPTFSEPTNNTFIETTNIGGFVSHEEAVKLEAVRRITVICKESETVDIIRLLSTNGFDCEVEK